MLRICTKIYMIVVKLLGGAKKTFPKYTPDTSETTISELLHDMVQNLPPNTPIPDTKNILVAINGVDSSVLDGRNTLIRDGDVVSIIPIIHGGSGGLWFDIPPYAVLVFCARTNTINLDTMRQSYPTLRIQAINPQYVLGESHLRRILEISITADKNKDILSNNLETDIIQRLAGTTQISKAIQTAGAPPNDTCLVISLGESGELRQLLYNVQCTTMKFSGNTERLRQAFGFVQQHRHAGYNLEDILVECASILR